MPVTFNWADPVTIATPIQNIDFHRMFANALKERLSAIYPEGYWDEYQTHHAYNDTTFQYMAINPDVDWPINVMNGGGDEWPWDFTMNFAIDGIKLYQNALFGRYFNSGGIGWYETGIVKRFIDLGAYNATGEIKPYTYATIRQQAGLNPAGFTRAKEYNSDGTPVVCGYGPIQDGDIIGPWIYNEIKACITLLQYRKESNDYVAVEGIHGWGQGEDLAQAKNDAATTNQTT